MIGASALLFHGFSRSTRDRDLLVLDARCLDSKFWSDLAAEGAELEIRRGDLFDPLAGLVRIRVGTEIVDLVLGKFLWQRDILERAEEFQIDDQPLFVARASDLILLKLHAGGPQDAWDIVQLLTTPERDAWVREVEGSLEKLPDSCTELWRKILSS